MPVLSRAAEDEAAGLGSIKIPNSRDLGACTKLWQGMKPQVWGELNTNCACWGRPGAT